MKNERIQVNPELSIQKIQDGIYVAIHCFPWPCNSLLVEMRDGQVVLIDTPNTPEATKILLDWIREYIGNRKITAFNSHFHFDCLGGNKTLLENGINLYGSILTAEMIKERGESVRAKVIRWLSSPENDYYIEAYRMIPYIAPTPIENLNFGRALYFGDETIEVFYPGIAHSPDNLVFYLPERRVLFGGCMLLSLEAKQLGNLEDADITQWSQSIRRIEERYPNIEIIIPGHGSWGGRELLTHTLEIVTK